MNTPQSAIDIAHHWLKSRNREWFGPKADWTQEQIDSHARDFGLLADFVTDCWPTAGDHRQDCSPASYIAEVIRKDEAAVEELKTLLPEYTPPDDFKALHARGKDAMATLDEMTALLRSAICICERQGTETNWEGFAASIRKLGLGGVTARTYRQANDKDQAQNGRG